MYKLKGARFLRRICARCRLHDFRAFLQHLEQKLLLRCAELFLGDQTLQPIHLSFEHLRDFVLIEVLQAHSAAKIHAHARRRSGSNLWHGRRRHRDWAFRTLLRFA